MGVTACDATLRWAATSVVGVMAFLATVIGYGCGTVFFLSAFLKPMFPSRIGLWLAPQHTLCFGYWNGQVSGTVLYGISVRPPAFVLGTLGPTDGPVRELLGAWLSPVAVFCGVLCFLATSLVARWFIARFKPRRNGVRHSLTRCRTPILTTNTKRNPTTGHLAATPAKREWRNFLARWL